MTSIDCNNQVFGALVFSSSVVLKPTEDTHWGYSFAGICIYVFVLLPYLGFVYFVLFHICSEDGPHCSFESTTHNSSGSNMDVGMSSDAGAGTGAGTGASSEEGSHSEGAPSGMVLNESSQVIAAKSNDKAMAGEELCVQQKDWKKIHHTECPDLRQEGKSDGMQQAPQEQSCFTKRIGKWKGGAAEEEARQVFSALAVTMRLWLEEFSTLGYPVKEKEDRQLACCDGVALELEVVFHRTSVNVIPEENVVTSLPQLTATLSVAPADSQATEGVADRAHSVDVQEFQQVLENSDSSGSDLDNAAHAAHDLSDKLRADGDLEAAAQMGNLALQLNAAADLKIPIRWPSQDETLLWMETFRQICEKIEEGGSAYDYTIRPPPSKGSTCCVQLHLEEACMEVCDEVCKRVDSLSHLELSACFSSQGNSQTHASQLDPSIESQVIFQSGTVSPATLSNSPAGLCDRLVSDQIITNCVSLRSICTEASEVHAKRRFAGRTQALYGIIYSRYVANSRHVEFMNHCCIISLGLVVGMCQGHHRLQVCCVDMHFC